MSKPRAVLHNSDLLADGRLRIAALEVAKESRSNPYVLEALAEKDQEIRTLVVVERAKQATGYILDPEDREHAQALIGQMEARLRDRQVDYVEPGMVQAPSTGSVPEANRDIER